MDKKVNRFRVNMSLRDIQPLYKKSLNSVKIEGGNTIDHELIKFLICFILKNEKHEFITEARFNLGGRADIYDLDSRVVYEVLHTEKEDNFEDKIKKYPNCDIIKIFTYHYKDKSPSDIISDLRDKLIL